jgi:glucosamine--fructose-6-phosphate aminotransferase (isomerizing)
MNENIPAGLRAAFERSQHPFLMWDGIQSIPSGAEEILSTGVREAIRAAAQAMKGKMPVHFTGAGTSYFVGIASVYAFHVIANYLGIAHNAFEFEAYPPPHLQDNTVVGISHTGGTPAVIDAVRLARERGALTIGYTDVTDSVLSDAADHLIVSQMGAEPSLPKTRSYIAALMRSYLLALELARLEGRDVSDFETELQKVPEQTSRVIGETEAQARELAKKYANISRIVVAGGGPQYATALEASLKITEAPRVHSTPWEIEEAVHGTWASTRSGDLVIVVAVEGSSSEKSRKLIEGMGTIEVETWAVSNLEGELPGASAITPLGLHAPEILMPLYAILPLYQFAYFLALERGVHPDSMNMSDPRYLKARTALRPTIRRNE